jgi:hypothetical protein
MAIKHAMPNQHDFRVNRDPTEFVNHLLLLQHRHREHGPFTRVDVGEADMIIG